MIIQRALQASAVANLIGGLLFAFPGSALGQLAGLPADVPGVYRALVTLFVLLFGGLYLWLSLQPKPDRPMLALGAIGKAAAFATIFALWLFAAVPGRMVMTISADLVLAAIYAWWLLGS